MNKIFYMKKFLFSLMVFIFTVVLFPKEAEAAISFVGVQAASSTPNTDTTVTLSGMGLAVGDLVIVTAGIGDDDNLNHDVLNNSAGWIEIDDLFADDTDDMNMAVFYKIMTSTPDTSVIIEGSTGGPDSSLAVVVMAFRGVDTTTPFDVSSTTATALNTADANPPSINHNNPSGVWIVIAGASSHILATLQTYTMPTGYTTDSISGGMLDTNHITVGMGYRSSGVSDPEDPGVMNHSGTDATTNGWGAITMALRPAVTVAPTVTTTNPATSITATSATLGGDMSSSGGANATVRGFAWGTSSGLLNGGSATTTESGSFTAGTFSQNISGLLAGVTYYFRAYATNSAGTGYGSIVSFIAGTDTTLRRKIRLFEGYKIRVNAGKIIIHQQ